MRAIRPVRAAVFALAAAVLALSSPARAEDAVGAPAGAPKPRAKIAHPYLDGLVGSWDLVAKPAGAAEQKGTARWRKALGGTALVEDLVVGEGAQAFFGLGVLLVGSDGKSIERWWFDSEGKGGVWHLTGTLRDDGWTLSSVDMGAKTDHVMTKSGDGHAYSMKTGDRSLFEVRYQRAAKERPPPPVVESLAIKHPFVVSMLGEFDVKGEVSADGATTRYGGVSSIRLAVGGAYAITEDQGAETDAPSFGLGVLSVDAAGATLREWGFSNLFDTPVVIAGTVSKTEWKAKGARSDRDEFESTATVTDAGFDVKVRFENGVAAHETYTRKK